MSKMLVALVLDQNGLVGGIRHSWKPYALNKPHPMLTFQIFRTEFPKLVEFLSGRPVMIGTPTRYDIKFGYGLYLVGLDSQNPLVRYDDLFKKAAIT